MISSGLCSKRHNKFSVAGQKDAMQPTIFLLLVIPTISTNPGEGSQVHSEAPHCSLFQQFPHLQTFLSGIHHHCFDHHFSPFSFRHKLPSLLHLPLNA